MAAHRFTPEMVRRLRGMAGRGFSAVMIAAELAKMTPLPITAQSVRVKCVEQGIKLRRDAKYRAEVRCTVSLDVWEKLRRMAYRRGLSVARFAQLFVEIAVDEGFVGKIIDDGHDYRRRRPLVGRVGRPRRVSAVEGVSP